MVYADSSFFVAVYVEDKHSKAAENLLASGERVWFTPLHEVEFAHAIAQHVFRHDLVPSDAREVEAEMEDDRAAALWVECRLPEGVFEVCTKLARQYGPKLGIRTLDSLHVACALELKAEHFWTFDERQAKLAKAVGLKIT